MSARSSISRRNKLERQFYPKWVHALSWYVEFFHRQEGWNTTGTPGPMIRPSGAGPFARYDRSAALMNLGDALSIARGWRLKGSVVRLRNHCSGQIIVVP